MRNSSSLDWLRFMHTPNDYRVSRDRQMYQEEENKGNLEYRHKKRSNALLQPLLTLNLIL